MCIEGNRHPDPPGEGEADPGKEELGSPQVRGLAQGPREWVAKLALLGLEPSLCLPGQRTLHLPLNAILHSRVDQHLLSTCYVPGTSLSGSHRQLGQHNEL